MEELAFSPIEKTISFYTRSDFAILNKLLTGDLDGLWNDAQLAYQDNQGIVDEYENGTRSIVSDYDIKWLACLKERLIHQLDDETKERIIATAKADISHILSTMAPAGEQLSLFRTAWIDKEYDAGGTYAYSRDYKAMEFTVGSVLEIETITSCSLTPYREDEDVGSDFYRYEICVPAGKNVLQLDGFVCHNEKNEVLLPPMRCKVTDIRNDSSKRCRKIIALEYMEQLPYKG